MMAYVSRLKVFKDAIKNINTSIPLTKTHFISQEIVNHLKEEGFINYHIFFKINESQYNINIYSKKEININKYIYFIKLILNLCDSEATIKNSNYTFKIILTDFKKTQPTIPIEPDSINSGLTSISKNNREIIN